MIISSLKQVRSFFYPPLCLHCQEKMDNSQKLLCTLCLEHLHWVTFENRCSRCCQTTCQECLVGIQRHAGSCEQIGAASTLFSHYQQGDVALCSAIGSLMAWQFLQLKWPVPDQIVPLTYSFFQKLSFGDDLNRLLAQQIGIILNCPLSVCLTRHFDLSFLTTETHFPWYFSLRASRRPRILADQTLLLVSTRYDHQLLNLAREALRDGFPGSVYSLSFI